MAAALPALASGRAAAAEPAPAAWTGVTTGYRHTNLAPFDEEWQNFMATHGIPGAQLAVAAGNRILLARGYSLTADPALRIEPTSLFRMGSLAKPLTGVAATRLLADEKLNILNVPTDFLPDFRPEDPNAKDAYVIRMLRHEAGFHGLPEWSTDRSTADQLRRLGHDVRLPLTREQLLLSMERQTLYPPGTRHSYSNNNYMLLSHIIAKAAGAPYETYVQDRILTPLGITRMRLGHTLQRAPGEVTYSVPAGVAKVPSVFHDDGRLVDAPYGEFNMNNWLGAGGWLASAVDYVQFLKVFGGLKEGVLSKGWVDFMKGKPETYADDATSWYGLGVNVAPNGSGLMVFHHGGGSGTHAYGANYPNGLSWALVINKSHRDHLLDVVKPLVDAYRRVTSWNTSYDLTPHYFPDAAT
ncbi:beta-lactamase family protein [Streptomyces sp. A7024]|uniref:Beta-lactamase family protein n=1 Tax=Streptomyces coryli TaxID=1128680 RepID=A0A6G4U3P4_9ACTN|nr:beta-lactamase family protein [Streptomyces coryli]